MKGVPVDAVLKDQGTELKARIIAVLPPPRFKAGMVRLDVLEVIEALTPGAVIGDGDLAQAETIFAAGAHFCARIPAAPVRQAIAGLLLHLSRIY